MSFADFNTSVRDGILVVRLEGEIDLSNARGIQSSVMREMENSLLGLVLDLSAVIYLDSAGIHAIFELRDDLETRGQAMRLVVPENSIVSTVLEVVDASGVVGIASSAQAAVAELSQPSAAQA